MSRPLRVGLVGANPNQSWAMVSHLPALEKLSDLQLTAVATSNIDTAKEAAAAFGVEEYHAGGEELAQSPNVDIVSISVKVPHHATLVRRALAAGKHVMCEWPLATDVAEAEALYAEAKEAGVHCGVGLQGRMSPAARRAREMVAAGLIGRPLTISVFDSSMGFGPTLPANYAYLSYEAGGANMTSILGGHTLDLCTHICGALTEVQAMGTIKWPTVPLIDAEGSIERDSPDNLSIHGRFANGAVLNLELDGGRDDNPPFYMKVTGTEGSLSLNGGHPFGWQAGDLTLESSVTFEAPETPAADGLAGATSNVGELYARFAKDIRNEEHVTPDFLYAAQLHKLICSVRIAAKTGQRQFPDDWPTG